MLDLLLDPATWIALLTLTVMEVVLGVDNVIFISVLVSKLPKPDADRARVVGLSLALIFRIVLLLVLSWVIALNAPVFTLFAHDFSWRDVILFAGGLFLIYKAVSEMHSEIEDPRGEEIARRPAGALSAVVTQIVLLDLVFSIDSIVTAIGMAQHVEVMIAAVIIAVGIMFAASGPIAGFVSRHPTTKMLALAFLVLIGVALGADGLGFHIDKGYIYAAMGFAVLVEAINIVARQRRTRATPGEKLKPEASVAVTAEAPRPKRRNAAGRSQAAPKSARRKKA